MLLKSDDKITDIFVTVLVLSCAKENIGAECINVLVLVLIAARSLTKHWRRFSLYMLVISTVSWAKANSALLDFNSTSPNFYLTFLK